MDISYTELRKLRLKAFCYDNDLVLMAHHVFHVALAFELQDPNYYLLLEYSESMENWYILNDGFEKDWLKDKFNKRSAEIDEDLAGLINL